jgi:hypothetical protein
MERQVFVVVEGYFQFGGRHTELAALRNILAFKQVKAPHTGRPFTEAFLLGSGGGIGFAYFLFERRGSRPVFLGTRIHTRETERPEFFQTIAGRLGFQAQVQNSSSATAALSNLRRSLSAEPVLVWTDAARLPYSGYTGFGNFYHVVVAYGLDEAGGAVQLADRAPGPVCASLQDFRHARETSWSPKYRSMTVASPQDGADPRVAAEQGIHQCVEQMLTGLGIANFGLKGMEKWATILTSTKEKKSWLKVYSPGADLYCALFTIYEQISVRGNVGAGSRTLYAEFLEEAADLLARPGLRDVAALYRESESLWQDVANAHLPGQYPIFSEACELAQERKRLFETRGLGGRERLDQIKARLAEIERSMAMEFPVPQNDLRALFGGIRQRILKMRDHESRCVEALQAAMA